MAFNTRAVSKACSRHSSFPPNPGIIYSDKEIPAALTFCPASICSEAVTPFFISSKTASEPLSSPMWTRSRPARRSVFNSSSDFRFTVLDRAYVVMRFTGAISCRKNSRISFNSFVPSTKLLASWRKTLYSPIIQPGGYVSVGVAVFGVMKDVPDNQIIHFPAGA